MNILKKMIPLFLALVMVLAMGSTAFAAGEGTITVNGATKDKIYDAYKVFDLTYAGTSAAYTIDPDWSGFFATGAAGAKYIVDTNSGSLNPITIGTSQKYINITTANVAAFAQDALAYAAKKSADKTETAGGATVTFTGLDLGYYLVYPQGATDIAAGNGSLCSLTSTMPTATVNVKATYPTIGKTVNDDSVDIGQTVTYTVTGKVPDTTGYDAYQYIVKDTLSAGLTFNEDVSNLTVKIDGTAVTVTPVYDANGFTLTMDMVDYQGNVGDNIEITYSAVVNANAVIGATGNANSATLEYSNDPTDSNLTTTTPPVIVKVYTATIKINKFKAGETATKLANAKFVLMDAANKYYKFTAANGTTPESVEWVDNLDDATVVTTNTEGTAFFNGIETGAYKLIETEAPAGYNKLANPVDININHTEQTDETELFQTADVANNTGSVLPSTGGIGTTIFYILGGLLMCGAVVMLITRKKMSGREN